jgi:hypothetical protein
MAGGLGSRAVLGRTSGRRRNWCRRRKRNRITAVLPLWLLRTVSLCLPALSSRVEWLRLDTELLLRLWAAYNAFESVAVTAVVCPRNQMRHGALAVRWELSYARLAALSGAAFLMRARRNSGSLPIC